MQRCNSDTSKLTVEHEELLVKAMNYARPKVSYIMRMHQDDVEDVLQEAAINAIKNRNSFEGRSSYNSWFMRIAINKSLEYLRRIKFMMYSLDTELEVKEGETPIVPDPIDEGPTPEEFVQQQEMRNLLTGGIDILSIKLRSALLLRYVEGYTIREVSRKIREPQTSIKSNCYRARFHMRQYLAEKNYKRN